MQNSREKNVGSLELEIRIHGVGRKLAEASIAAVKPDNLESPEGIEITEHIDNNDLVINVKVASDKIRLGTLRNTVDELLEYLYSFMLSVEELAKTFKEEKR